MGSQNWWFGDARTLLWASTPTRFWRVHSLILGVDQVVWFQNWCFCLVFLPTFCLFGTSDRFDVLKSQEGGGLWRAKRITTSIPAAKSREQGVVHATWKGEVWSSPQVVVSSERPPGCLGYIGSSYVWIYVGNYNKTMRNQVVVSNIVLLSPWNLGKIHIWTNIIRRGWNHLGTALIDVQHVIQYDQKYRVQ